MYIIHFNKKNALNKFILLKNFVEEAKINQTKYLIEMRDTQKLKEKIIYLYTFYTQNNKCLQKKL